MHTSPAVTPKQNKAPLAVEQDLNLMLVVSGVILVANFILQPLGFLKDMSKALWLRTLVALALQFGVMGLGVTAVLLLRKESPARFGLGLKGMPKALVLSVLSCAPLLGVYLVQGFVSYAPLSALFLSQEWLSLEGPRWLIGYLPLVLVWGLIQGFSYGVICDKLNLSDPVKNPLFAMGPIYCGIIYLLLNGYGLSLPKLPETLGVFVAVWGLLQTRRLSGNSWGIMAAFTLFFYAFRF